MCDIRGISESGCNDWCVLLTDCVGYSVVSEYGGICALIKTSSEGCPEGFNYSPGSGKPKGYLDLIASNTPGASCYVKGMSK